MNRFLKLRELPVIGRAADWGMGRVAVSRTELALSTVNERRLVSLARALEDCRAGRLMRAAKWAVRGGLALRAARSAGPAGGHLSSALFLLGDLAFRFGWLAAGRASAADADAVVTMARRA